MLRGGAGPDGVTTGQQGGLCQRGDAPEPARQQRPHLVPTSLPHGSSRSGGESFQKYLQKLSVSPVFLDFPGLLSICSKMQ